MNEVYVEFLVSFFGVKRDQGANDCDCIKIVDLEDGVFKISTLKET